MASELHRTTSTRFLDLHVGKCRFIPDTSPCEASSTSSTSSSLKLLFSALSEVKVHSSNGTCRIVDFEGNPSTGTTNGHRCLLGFRSSLSSEVRDVTMTHGIRRNHVDKGPQGQPSIASVASAS